MPSWNEYALGPTEMTTWDITDPYFHSMGSDSDPKAKVFFYDGFGTERSRTIEPTVDDQGYYYKLLQSCMRVSRVLKVWGGNTCNVTNEMCCQYTPEENYANIWSLEKLNGTDTILAVSADEVKQLIKTGAWKEICNPWDGTTDFCANQDAAWHPPDNYDVIRGPFLLYSNQSTTVAQTHPIYRCTTSTGNHLVSALENCEQLGTKEFIIGLASSQKSSATPRPLRRCLKSNNSYYHTIDGPCRSTDVQQILLGYAV